MKRSTSLLILAGTLLGVAAGRLDAQDTVFVYEPRVCGRLGISVADFADGEPLRITAVMRGSPAERAGLRPGDVILRIDGAEASPSVLRSFTNELKPGEPVRLRIRRDGQEHDARLVATGDMCVRRAVRTFTADSGRAAVYARRGDGVYRFQLPNDSTAVLWFKPSRAQTIDLHRWLEESQREHRERVQQMRQAQAELLQQMRQAHGERLQRLRQEQERALARQRALWDSIMKATPDRQVEQLAARAQDNLERAMQFRAAAAARPMPAPMPMAYAMSLGWHAIAGAELSELNPELAEYFGGADEGLLVLRVAPSTPGARAGLRPGDVIVHAGEVPVRSVADLRFAVLAAGREPVPLIVVRKGARRQLVLPARR